MRRLPGVLPEFRSTPPRRGRRVLRAEHVVLPRVSIHAPAKGATHMTTTYSGPWASFDPRPREGGDCIYRRGFAHIIVSIHAPAKGATPAGSVIAQQQQFRSTPPRRGRPSRGKPEQRPTRVSIHAPAKGATRRVGRPGAMMYSGFDPRPREGGDALSGFRPETTSRFDPRPREGGDHTLITSPALVAAFRSTPPRRGRPLPCSPSSHCSSFDPRPREGGDAPKETSPSSI